MSNRLVSFTVPKIAKANEQSKERSHLHPYMPMRSRNKNGIKSKALIYNCGLDGVHCLLCTAFCVRHIWASEQMAAEDGTITSAAILYCHIILLEHCNSKSAVGGTRKQQQHSDGRNPVFVGTLTPHRAQVFPVTLYLLLISLACFSLSRPVVEVSSKKMPAFYYNVTKQNMLPQGSNP